MGKRKETTKGFTLIELMITLVIAIVVLSLGIPGIARLKQSSELTTVTNDLIAAMSLARSEAIKRSGDTTFTPVGGSWNNGWEIRVAGPDTLVRVFEAPPAGTSVTSTVSPVTFDAMGSLAANACFDVAIVNGIDKVRSVPVSTTGRMTSCKVKCSDIAPNVCN